MDYRERNYYLATIDYCSYDMRMKHLKIVAPSLKIHSPYNHFKHNKDYDGVFTNKQGYGGYWQMMLSCRKENSEALEYELNKGKRNSRLTNFLKLNKELCGQ